MLTTLSPLHVYSITFESPLFPGSVTEDGIILLEQLLDYETTVQSYSNTTEVTDSSHMSETTVTIDVLPVNDERPVLDVVGKIVAIYSL